MPSQAGAYLNKSSFLPTSSFLHLVLLPIGKDHFPLSACPELDPDYTNKRGVGPLDPTLLQQLGPLGTYWLG